jgi:thiosulfate reductase cytochrome b subunit
MKVLSKGNLDSGFRSTTRLLQPLPHGHLCGRSCGVAVFLVVHFASTALFVLLLLLALSFCLNNRSCRRRFSLVQFRAQEPERGTKKNLVNNV